MIAQYFNVQMRMCLRAADSVNHTGLGCYAHSATSDKVRHGVVRITGLLRLRGAHHAFKVSGMRGMWLSRDILMTDSWPAALVSWAFGLVDRLSVFGNSPTR